LRAVQTEKLLLTSLSVMPVAPMVSLTGVNRPHVTTYKPIAAHEAAAQIMLDELHAWAVALTPMRTTK
jgi:hypothetical protein